MNASTIIVLLIVIVIAFFALKSSLGHFKGEGDCCGGGGGTLPDTKELEGAKIGEKIVRIEGMHCENCKNRVERAINRIDGAVAKVSSAIRDWEKWTPSSSFGLQYIDSQNFFLQDIVAL